MRKQTISLQLNKAEWWAWREFANDEEIGYGKLSEYSVYSVETEWQIYFPAWQASFRGWGARVDERQKEREAKREVENERETVKENGRKRMRRREAERIGEREKARKRLWVAGLSEKGCNKKEREGAIGPPVSLLGIYNPMISFCTPAKPSHPRHQPWAKRSHGRVADIMVYCSQWCSNTFHFECLRAVTPINLSSLKDLDVSISGWCFKTVVFL